MIDIIKQTPFEYSKQSRDYQVLARLYTALFNYTKMYIDDLSIWNNDIDNKLTSLRALTLNFEADHTWDEDDLEAVTSCFKYLVRNKGTTKVLEYCINILMKIEHLSGEGIENPVTILNDNVTITIPENLLTIGVIEDLVKYLLPAGLTYKIIKYKAVDIGGLNSDLFYTDQALEAYESYYDDRMTIGPSNDILRRSEEGFIPVTSDTKIWAGIQDGPFIPDNNTGIDHEEGVVFYDSEGNAIPVNRQDTRSFEIERRILDIDKTRNINDTFVYNNNENEEWRDGTTEDRLIFEKVFEE